MSAFDRAHMTSCLTLIETMHLSCIIFGVIASYFILIYSTCIWHPSGGDPFKFHGDVWQSLDYHVEFIVRDMMVEYFEVNQLLKDFF